jgi:sec-independent protein translocase protein TatA
MFNLGMGELLTVILVALLVFGPHQLPKITRTIGRAIREFKLAMDLEPEDDEPEPGSYEKSDSDDKGPCDIPEEPDDSLAG